MLALASSCVGLFRVTVKLWMFTSSSVLLTSCSSSCDSSVSSFAATSLLHETSGSSEGLAEIPKKSRTITQVWELMTVSRLFRSTVTVLFTLLCLEAKCGERLSMRQTLMCIKESSWASCGDEMQPEGDGGGVKG
uniref:Putative secreted protein n=1 Tax=Ixodes ricinus TaxID=34613 RepID=A0A6B0US58_IXORI